jgi:cell division transport system permease protein
LPASFELDLYDDWKTADKMSALAGQIQRQKGVESVVYGESWVEKLERWIYFFVAVDLFLGFVLGLSTLLVVGNTLKLAMADRRDAIEVLRLVGATRTQIRLPYLMEGAFLGLVSASLALFLLQGSHRFAAERLPGVLFLGEAGSVLFVLLGVVLGAAGAYVSIQKYLKVSLS